MGHDLPPSEREDKRPVLALANYQYSNNVANVSRLSAAERCTLKRPICKLSPFFKYKSDQHTRKKTLIKSDFAG